MKKITRILYVALLIVSVMLMFVPGFPTKGWVDENGNSPSPVGKSEGYVYSNRWHLTDFTLREKIPLFWVFAMLVTVGITEARKKHRNTNQPMHGTAYRRP